MRLVRVLVAVLVFSSVATAFLPPATLGVRCLSAQKSRFSRACPPTMPILMGGDRQPLWRSARLGIGRFFVGKEDRGSVLKSTVAGRVTAPRGSKERKENPDNQGVLLKALEVLRDIYGQFMVLFMDTLIQKPFLHILNKVHITNHKRLTDLISKRPRGTPLITVSNHCSSLDEPLLFSALIPWPIKQWQLRYSLCNDNMFYVFGKVFAQLFFYAARGLPIFRSQSVNQPYFWRFCNKARDGGWCHIFPEGRIWQPWKLQNKGVRLGDLRPGVGKLIAHCDTSKHPPVVLPFYHTGMHRVLPQFPNSKKQSMPPKIGNTIRIRVGEPIDMSDLLKEYKESREQARQRQGITDGWTSTEADQELYDKITKRVEAALLDLAKEVDPEVEWQTHPSVLPAGKKKSKK